MDEIQTSLLIKFIGFILDVIIIIFNIMSLQKVLPKKKTLYVSKAAQTCSKDIWSDSEEDFHYDDRKRVKYHGNGKYLLNRTCRSPTRRCYKLNSNVFRILPVKDGTDKIQNKHKSHAIHTSKSMTIN